MTHTQPTMFSTDAYGDVRPRRLSIDARFDRLMLTDNGRAIYAAYVANALARVERGERHLSSDRICHDLRFDTSLRTDGEPFKIQDHFSALLSRRAMEREPKLRGMFETRKRKVTT